MPPSSLWNQVTHAGPAGVVLAGATLALLGLPVLRRLAPHGHRHRGRPARLFLGLALLLAGSAISLGTMGAASPGNVLQLAGVVALMLGLVGVSGLVLFDVVLPRLGLEVPSILRDLIVVAVALAVGMGFLRLAGLDLFSLVTTSAVLTAVIGLALQGTIANVFGGLGLQVDRTLRHGEWIEVGGHVGRILEIGWRSTRIQTKDGDTVFVPNSELVSKDVRNFARPVGAHRMTVRIGFHYRHPPNEVRRVLLAAVRDCPGIAAHPAPQCGPADFGDSAVVYALRYWITDFADDTTIDEEVRTRLWYAAERAALEIPAPIRTLVPEHAAAGARAAAEEQAQEDAVRILGAVEPFSRLDAESRRRCARGVRRLRFGEGEDVLRPEEDAHVYVIASGDVDLHLPANGTAREDTTLRAGQLLGRRLLGGRDGSAPACTARSDVVLYRLDHGALGEVVAAIPELAAGLSTLAARASSRNAGGEPGIEEPEKPRRRVR